MVSIREKLGKGLQRISALSGKKKIILSIIVVLIFVSGSFAAITYLLKETPSYHSPEVDFHVSFINNTTDSYSSYSPMDQFYNTNTPFNTYNMSNVTVNVYATMPSFAALGDESMSVNGSTTNNSIYVQLFNSTLADANGNIHGVLSKVFHTIIRQYRQIYTKPQEKTISISMTLQADYQFVYQNKMYVYTYYNNIPFDPWNSSFGDSSFNPTTFSSNIYFNMNSPPIVMSINSTNNSVDHLHKMRQIGGGGGGGGGAIRCNNDVTQYIYQFKGPMPILIGNIPVNALSALSYSYSSLQGSYTVSLDGNQESYTTGGWVDQTSTSGAWSDSNANFQIATRDGGSTTSSNPEQYQNISMIGYGNFTMQMVFTKTIYESVDGSYCVDDGTSYSSVTQVINANNGSFDYEEGFAVNLYHIPEQDASTFVNLDWNAFFDSGLTVDHQYTGVRPGSTNITNQFSFFASGYETATQQEIQSINTKAMILGAVSLGLSIAATVAVLIAAPETAGLSLAALVFTVGGLETAAGSVGGAIYASYLQSQSTPMFISTAQINVDTYMFSNTAEPFDNSNITINLYQSAQQENMNIGGTIYSFNVQSPYVYAYTT